MKPKDQERAPEQYHDYLSLTEAKDAMGFAHTQYVRRLLHESIEAVEKGEEPKLPWPDDDRPLAVKLTMGGYDKWFIHPDSCENYEAQASGIGTGLRRYLFRFNLDWLTEEAAKARMAEVFGDSSEDTYIFEPASKGSAGKKGKSKSKAPEDFTATIVAALSAPNPRARAGNTPDESTTLD